MKIRTRYRDGDDLHEQIEDDLGHINYRITYQEGPIHVGWDENGSLYQYDIGIAEGDEEMQ